MALLVLLLPIPAQATPRPGRELGPAPIASGQSADGHSIYLPALFGSAPAKSSFELIDEALRAGELDDETALIYQVYAITLDPRLPARYRGVDKEDLECGEWQGAVTAVHRDDVTGRHDLEAILTTATFEPEPASSGADVEFAMFQLKQGSMHWEYTGTLGDCQIEADSVDVALQPPNHGGLAIRRWSDDSSLIGEFEGIGTSSYAPTLTYVCPEGNLEAPWQTMPWLDTGSIGTNNVRVSADGTTMAGRYEWGTPGEGRSMVVDWHFVAVLTGE